MTATLTATSEARGANAALTDRHSPYSLHFWLEQFEEEEDWPAVRRTARELLHLAPKNPEALKYLAEALFRLGQPVEAYDTAMSLIEANPVSIDGYWILSDLAAQANDLERSADYIEQAARLIPNSDAIWVEVAKANFNLRRLPRCLVAADHGLRVNPYNIRLLLFKVFCLAGLRSKKGARIAAGKLVELGVDAEVLKETAKELGITASFLGRLQNLANGSTAAVNTTAATSRRKLDTVINESLSMLSEITEKAPPLTKRQFEMQLAAAEVLREMEQADDDPEPSVLEPGDPEAEIETASMVYYLYANFRTYGPYLRKHVLELFQDGTFKPLDTFIRRETDDQWRSYSDYEELTVPIAVEELPE